MRLQKLEQVPCEDTELVLAVLEDRLQTLTIRVEREGERITMFGLGPSPRAVNPRDVTVIDVKPADGMTLISADVNFTASAFLGELPQDTIVLGKLERVFEELREEVARKAHSNGVKVRTNVVVMEHALSVMAESSVAMAEPHGGRDLEETRAEASVPETPHVVSVEEMRAVATGLEQEEKASKVRAGRRWSWMAAACVGTLGLALAGARYFGYLPTSDGGREATTPAVVPAAEVSTADKPATVTSPGKSEDSAGMLKEWQTAMQSNNAEAQAAFYAHRVDRYITRNNVSRQAIAADKQAAIDKRKLGWTETLDDVNIQQQGDDAATVRLVKHFKVTPDGATVPEWFIPARLQLKRVDGAWRIVGESDLGWVTSMDDWQ